MKTRKDAKPADTIKRIKRILKMHSIDVIEISHFSISNKIFSVRLEMKKFPNIGVNGKGFSKKYALASAYGELMERIQSRLLIKPYFTNKIYKAIYFSDEFLVSYDEFKKLFSKSLGEKIIDFTKEEELYRVCTNFDNPITGESQVLPIRIINKLTHSNGLCAGNTYEEAVSQGICEIFERFCYKSILLNELELPTINDISHTDSFSKLEYLKKLGFSYCIKDCSLGKYPVVGLIVYSKDKTKYLFSIGSDSDFDIALQRCISEIFQGLNIEAFKNKMKSIDNTYFINKKEYGSKFVILNWLKSYTSNNGIHPESIFVDNTYSSIGELPFAKNTLSNKESLKFLFNIIKNNDLQVYIKDYSFLGFPTYKVYIPRLSEVNILEDFEFDIMLNHNRLLELYYNLLSSKESDTIKSMKILMEMAKEPKYSDFIFPSNYFNLHSFIDTNISSLNYFNILVLLLLKHKKYLELENMCADNDFLSKYNDCIKYIRCIIESDENERESLSRKYLEKYNFPSCPDCENCRCKDKCKFDDWLELNKLLNEKHKSWIAYKNNEKKDMEKIFLKKVKPELTQCRIIQIDVSEKEG